MSYLGATLAIMGAFLIGYSLHTDKVTLKDAQEAFRCGEDFGFDLSFGRRYWFPHNLSDECKKYYTPAVLTSTAVAPPEQPVVEEFTRTRGKTKKCLKCLDWREEKQGDMTWSYCARFN